MQADSFGQLAANLDHRIQRRHRILEDHSQGPATNLAQLPSRRSRQVSTLVDDRATDYLRTPREKTHDSEERHAFARPGLTDDTQHLILTYVERQVIDHSRPFASWPDLDGQVLDGQQRRGIAHIS
jgi:hypothetical protein